MISRVIVRARAKHDIRAARLWYRICSIIVSGLPALLSVALAPTAYACGACIHRAIEVTIPSIKFWSLLAIAWFIANGIVRSMTGISLPWQPRTLGAIGIALLAVLFSAVSGPPYAVLFLIVTSWAFVLSLRKPELRPVRIIGAIAFLACAGLAFQSSRELRRTPTRAERIASLGATAFGRHELALLRREEPTSLGTYRELLRLGDSTIVIKVAERIAVIGEPQVDLPLLEQALNRFAADDYTAEQIVLAMQKLRTKSSTLAKTPADRQA